MRRKQFVLIILCILLAGMVFTACHKNKKVSRETAEDTSQEREEPTVTPAKKAAEPEDTQKSTGASTEDIQETNSETEDISKEQAVNFIQNAIDDRGYYFDLLDDNIKVGDNTYYLYQISDSTDSIDPNVLVNKKNGELLCYYSDRTTGPFTDYPLYTKKEEQTKESGTSGFTKEDALDQLSKLSEKTLDLPEELSKYTILFDNWSTNIDGVDCYGINVYSDAGDRMISMGQYYVAVDGSVMYKLDAVADDFIEIK